MTLFLTCIYGDLKETIKKKETNSFLIQPQVLFESSELFSLLNNKNRRPCLGSGGSWADKLPGKVPGHLQRTAEVPLSKAPNPENSQSYLSNLKHFLRQSGLSIFRRGGSVTVGVCPWLNVFIFMLSCQSQTASLASALQSQRRSFWLLTL